MELTWAKFYWPVSPSLLDPYFYTLEQLLVCIVNMVMHDYILHCTIVISQKRERNIYIGITLPFIPIRLIFLFTQPPAEPFYMLQLLMICTIV